MNVEMNWKNDVNDYYDENDAKNDCVSGSVNVSENENELDYCHYVCLIDCYCYYFEHFRNDLSMMMKMMIAVVLLDDLV